ncbi:sensor histidine kinase [Gimesia panareensis]|uniref:histidine kinase n=1 Tax=Gimesia panareensis TaxID=2527978 RepID=A0A518A2F9_9PLAN|nr:HAMP domain-containing sensor histidine kinase [Gimesia panareensis]QDT25978.1 Sporulation kinase D [Gimesia panareensis]QDU48915.1 Sporulation kinase D [Gimesia panareensis]
MSSDTGSVETHIPAAIYRRLWSLIPTRSPGSTLCELSSIWCEATGAAAVYLGMYEPEAARLTAALFRASEAQVTSLQQTAVPVIPKYSSEEQLQSLLEQAHTFAEISDQPAHAYFQACSEGTVLGLFLFSSVDRHGNDPLICELLDVSQRLLNQALLQGAGGSDQSAQTAGWIIPDVEKLEAMAEFAAGAGHEINNPVATIVGRVQMLLKSETDPERRQALATIGGQAYRVRDMIGDAMLFARPPAPRPELLSFSTTMQEVMDSLQEEVSQAGVQVVVDAADALTVLADEVQWKVVLSNLLLNSLHAMEPGGKLQVRASQSEIESGRILHLQIIDDGAGLSEEERVHLFDPFYSARQAGRGLGFGLSKCWRIATQHGATIAVEPNRQRGVTFHLYWPAESPIISSD